MILWNPPSRGWISGPNSVESPQGVGESGKDASEVGGRVTPALDPSPSLQQHSALPRRRQSPGGQTCLRPRRSSSTSSASLSAANTTRSAPKPLSWPGSVGSSSTRTNATPETWVPPRSRPSLPTSPSIRRSPPQPTPSRCPVGKTGPSAPCSSSTSPDGLLVLHVVKVVLPAPQSGPACKW